MELTSRSPRRARFVRITIDCESGPLEKQGEEPVASCARVCVLPSDGFLKVLQLRRPQNRRFFRSLSNIFGSSCEDCTENSVKLPMPEVSDKVAATMGFDRISARFIYTRRVHARCSINTTFRLPGASARRSDVDREAEAERALLGARVVDGARDVELHHLREALVQRRRHRAVAVHARAELNAPNTRNRGPRGQHESVSKRDRSRRGMREGMRSRPNRHNSEKKPSSKGRQGDPRRTM